MGRQKKTKAENWNGQSVPEIAEAEAKIFIARYSDQAERVAELVIEKIRARQRHGRPASTD